MRIAERQLRLDGVLTHFQDLWRPQPFREIRPAWAERLPAMTAALLALPDAAAEHLNSDGQAALDFLVGYLPALADFDPLVELPVRRAPSDSPGNRWAWDIPGRKRQQIEAFATAAEPCGRPVLDWCGGKGHLGRLLALRGRMAATTLEIDPVLCAAGRELADRARVHHRFVTADALTAGDTLCADQHLVALHACGDLHRHAIREGADRRVSAFDIAPCCYFRGVADTYRPLAVATMLRLSRDDLRLAVTETVTASPRLARQRDRAMAWKLGFDALRRDLLGISYRPFKPVKGEWLRADFPIFCRLMAEREGLALPQDIVLAEFEARGRQRQRDVFRLSIVRHGFRRALEIWLVADLALYLERRDYQVDLAIFCPRQLTPRNLLLSARC